MKTDLAPISDLKASRKENRPSVLLCEQGDNPLGIDSRQPRLSWRMISEGNSLSQTGYQILVATSAQKLARDEGDQWNSGRITSSQSAQVAYDGLPLESRATYFWKVRSWDQDENGSDYSDVATFEMGLLKEEDWRARWIGMPGRESCQATYFRVAFHLEEPPVKARLYVSGLGYYETYINGQRQGDAVLEPAYTDISQTVPYQTFDVTLHLKAGENVIASIVGAGWHTKAIFLAQLEVEAADGTRTIVTPHRDVTTPVWIAARGPIISNSIFDGETYDARRERIGWTTTTYDPACETDRSQIWIQACFVRPPSGRMVAQMMEPIKVVKTLPPASIHSPRDGVYVFDFGQNHAGWCRLKVRGAAGDTITLRHAEVLQEDGTVNQTNLRGATATDSYILKGGEEECWEPRFTYHGYRYVQVEGWPGTPSHDSLTSCVVRTALAFRGKFDCSDELLNRIHQLVRWTEESNLHGLPTDCPQRDERMGWLNDLAARSEELVYNFESDRFLRKFVSDIAHAQDPQNGALSDTAPFHWGAQPADPVSVCYLLIPHLLDQHYKDSSVLEPHYDGFRRWVDFLTSQSAGHIVSYSHYGDWAPPESESLRFEDYVSPLAAHTPGPLVSTAFYYYATILFVRFSRRLGHAENAEIYAKLATQIRESFHDAFWSGDDVGYGSGNQACNSLALYLDLVPKAKRATVTAALVRDVEAHDHHLTTGNLCSKYLLEILAKEGHFSTAFRVATQTTYPSWGFMLENGATTIWERWEYLTGGGMNSHNHPMLGSIGSWLYRWVAGLTISDASGNTPHFEIRIPRTDLLAHASASLQTSWGEAAIAWKRAGNRLSVVIEIPWNCSGTVHLYTSEHELQPGRHEFSENLAEVANTAELVATA